jgi:hypothetical protein
VRLNRKFFEVMLKSRPRFIILREKVTGDMIAFMLCFDMGERLINAFTGMDYGRPKEWMLYFRLWDAAVDLALSRGFTAIVSGRLSYEAKIEIGHKLVPLNNCCRHRNIFFHNVLPYLRADDPLASMDEALARFLKAHPDTTVA